MKPIQIGVSFIQRSAGLQAELVVRLDKEEYEALCRRRIFARKRINGGTAYHHYDEATGLVSFAWQSEQDKSGALGGEYRLESGEILTLGGLWASNGEYMKTLGFPPSLPCLLLIDDENGHPKSHFMSEFALERFLLIQEMIRRGPEDERGKVEYLFSLAMHRDEDPECFRFVQTYTDGLIGSLLNTTACHNGISWSVYSDDELPTWRGMPGWW